MSPLLIGPILEIGKGIINRLFPDPAQAAAAQLELLKMQQNGDLAQLAAETDLAKLQIQVNPWHVRFAENAGNGRFRKPGSAISYRVAALCSESRTTKVRRLSSGRAPFRRSS